MSALEIACTIGVPVFLMVIVINGCLLTWDARRRRKRWLINREREWRRLKTLIDSARR